MATDRLILAVIVGILQGIFEWLPISSEGSVALYLTVVEGLPAEAAVRYALFLHVGTAIAAIAYYRDELSALTMAAVAWRPRRGRGRERPRTDGAGAVGPTHDGRQRSERVAADLPFLVLATLVSGVVGIATYLALTSLVSALAGGAFVALVGVLLVLTGLVQRVAADALGAREEPTLPDAVLVGLLQGLAVLPGVSRSGTTVGALLLRGYRAPVAFRLSFLLSIPAALGAGLLVVLDVGLPTLGGAAAVALAVSAVVGYASIDALMRLARRVPFWGVCVGLGGLAIVGGLLALGL